VSRESVSALSGLIPSPLGGFGGDGPVPEDALFDRRDAVWWQDRETGLPLSDFQGKARLVRGKAES